jgi:hypothetical protein
LRLNTQHDIGILNQLRAVGHVDHIREIGIRQTDGQTSASFRMQLPAQLHKTGHYTGDQSPPPLTRSCDQTGASAWT